MSGAGLRFAILAHERPQALSELVDALRSTHPGCAIGVFNGGTDPHLTDGTDAEVLPASRPLRHGHLAGFHDAALTWAGTAAWLVTLDSDVLPVRGGLREHLDALACDYAAGHLSQVGPGTPWRPGRRFLRSWPQWQPVLAIDQPWRCFNPVQAFSRSYTEAYLAWPARSALLELVHASSDEALEEIVWPSVGAALGLRLGALGGDKGLRLRPPTPYELRDHLADPAVHFVHKVRTSPDAAERLLVLAHLRGEVPDFDRAQRDAPQPASESWLRAAAAWGKDVQQWLGSRTGLR